MRGFGGGFAECYKGLGRSSYGVGRRSRIPLARPSLVSSSLFPIQYPSWLRESGAWTNGDRRTRYMMRKPLMSRQKPLKQRC